MRFVPTKFCITAVCRGRYKIEVLDEDNQIQASADGGLATVMVMLSGWLFNPEQEQYEEDQRANSDALGDTTIQRMRDHPEEFLPPKA